MWSQTKKETFLAVAGLAGILIYAWWTFHRPLMGSEVMLHGDFGDGRLVILFLEHTYKYLRSDWITEYWATPWNFHPYHLTLAMSEPLSGNFILYAPLRLLGMSMEMAGEWWVLISGILNLLTTFFLLRAMGGKIIASLAGSYLICYSLIRLGYMNHPHLFPNYPGNIAIIAGIACMRNRDVRRQIIFGTIAGLTLAWQFWASLHLGWFTFFGISCVFGFAMLLPSRRETIEVLFNCRWGVLAAMIAFGILLWPLYSKMMEFQKAYGEPRHISETYAFMLKSPSYLYPVNATSTYYWLFELMADKVGGGGEKSAFMGFVPLFAALFAAGWALYTVRVKKSGMELVAAVCALSFLMIVLVCTKDILGVKLWKVFYRFFPGTSGIRATGRICILQCFFMGTIVCYFLTKLETPRWKYLPALLLAVILCENYAPAFDVVSEKDNRAKIAEFDQRVKAACPFQYDAIYDRRAIIDPFEKTLAMWYSMENRSALINGYSGYVPRQFKLTSDSTPEDIVKWYEMNGAQIQASRICIVP